MPVPISVRSFLQAYTPTRNKLCAVNNIHQWQACNVFYSDLEQALGCAHFGKFGDRVTHKPTSSDSSGWSSVQAIMFIMDRSSTATAQGAVRAQLTASRLNSGWVSLLLQVGGGGTSRANSLRTSCSASCSKFARSRPQATSYEYDTSKVRVA